MGITDEGFLMLQNFQDRMRQLRTIVQQGKAQNLAPEKIWEQVGPTLVKFGEELKNIREFSQNLGEVGDTLADFATLGMDFHGRVSTLNEGGAQPVNAGTFTPPPIAPFQSQARTVEPPPVSVPPELEAAENEGLPPV